MDHIDHILKETDEEKQRLLDTFAAAALTGYLASYSGENVKTPRAEDVARVVYDIAACMVEERAGRDTLGEITIKTFSDEG